MPQGPSAHGRPDLAEARPARPALRKNDPEETFHEVRIRAKRARYAAEAVATALDPKAARAASKFAKAAQRVQDLLGTHQDAVVARETVERLADEIEAEGAEVGPDFRPAVDRLIRSQDADARKARKRFPKVWKKIDRPKRRAWFSR